MPYSAPQQQVIWDPMTGIANILRLRNMKAVPTRHLECSTTRRGRLCKLQWGPVSTYQVSSGRLVGESAQRNIDPKVARKNYFSNGESNPRSSAFRAVRQASQAIHVFWPILAEKNEILLHHSRDQVLCGKSSVVICKLPRCTIYICAKSKCIRLFILRRLWEKCFFQ